MSRFPQLSLSLCCIKFAYLHFSHVAVFYKAISSFSYLLSVCCFLPHRPSLNIDKARFTNSTWCQLPVYTLDVPTSVIFVSFSPPAVVVPSSLPSILLVLSMQLYSSNKLIITIWPLASSPFSRSSPYWYGMLRFHCV